MTDITAAGVALVEPMQYGGWGYQLGWRVPALVIRRGVALVLGLLDGRRFTVTVDDAAQAAVLVNDYRDTTQEM